MENPWKKYSKINPQRENGHREIENSIWQALMRQKFSGVEWDVVAAIIDRIYGFGKHDDRISYGQLVRMTNRSRRHIIRAIKTLEERRIIVVTHKSPVDLKLVTRKALVNTILFNKHHDTWLLVTHKSPPPTSDGEVTTTSDGEVTRLVTGKSLGTAFKPTSLKGQRGAKETLKETILKKETFVETAPAFQLSRYLLEQIRKRKPDITPPNLQSWAKDMDRMLRIDGLDKKGRKPEIVKRVIDWCQKDDFWVTNILSVVKLRKHFDTLQMKMEQSTKVKSSEISDVVAEILDGYPRILSKSKTIQNIEDLLERGIGKEDLIRARNNYMAFVKKERMPADRIYVSYNFFGGEASYWQDWLKAPPMSATDEVLDKFYREVGEREKKHGQSATRRTQ